MFTLIKENKTNVAIPEEGSITDSIAISKSGSIRALKINANLSNTNKEAVALKVITPSGKEIALTNEDSSYSYSGDLFSSIIGEQAKGNWTLSAASANAGTLNSWELELDCEAYDNHKAEIFIPALESDQALISTQECRFNGRILEIFSSLEVEHPLIGDLVASIISPSGTEVIIHDRTGGSQNHLKGTYTGDSLKAFVGEKSNGIWTLKIKNHHSSNNGVLKHWKIKFHYEPEDDLKVVEGIGPKIEGLLKNAGIYSFVSLATTSPEAIKEILLAAGDRYKMHDPGTWPAQSSLAAQGRWGELDTLKDELNGGR